MKNEIIIFENQDVKLEVNMKGETVWLSLEQMGELFGRDRTVITRHINNIFKDKELEEKEVCAKFAHTTQHGSIAGKTQTRELNYYNLDMIISVGYRVKSQNVELNLVKKTPQLSKNFWQFKMKEAEQ